MRRLAITKRVSLDGVEEGWGSDCYADVLPTTYDDFIEASELSIDDKTAVERLKYQLDFVKKHLIGGKVNVLDDDGKVVLDDLLPEDVNASRKLTDKLYTEIIGVNLDPKVSSTETETLSTNEASISTNS